MTGYLFYFLNPPHNNAFLANLDMYNLLVTGDWQKLAVMFAAVFVVTLFLLLEQLQHHTSALSLEHTALHCRYIRSSYIAAVVKTTSINSTRGQRSSKILLPKQ